jgi:hypothetical protein
LYSSTNIRVIKSRRIGWAGYVARTGFWCEKVKEGRSLGRPRRRWEDNIKTDLKWNARV